MAPFKTQMQQEKEKYKNAANSVGEWPLFKKLRKKPDMVQTLLIFKSVCTVAKLVPDFGAETLFYRCKSGRKQLLLVRCTSWGLRQVWFWCQAHAAELKKPLIAKNRIKKRDCARLTGVCSYKVDSKLAGDVM